MDSCIRALLVGIVLRVGYKPVLGPRVGRLPHDAGHEAHVAQAEARQGEGDAPPRRRRRRHHQAGIHENDDGELGHSDDVQALRGERDRFVRVVDRSPHEAINGHRHVKRRAQRVSAEQEHLVHAVRESQLAVDLPDRPDVPGAQHGAVEGGRAHEEPQLQRREGVDGVAIVAVLVQRPIKREHHAAAHREELVAVLGIALFLQHVRGLTFEGRAGARR
mmetsp:Transcript_39481/g.122116  ORF Transcript_39481/g.122116 Transcript_39481/m.122116 type:complete len:219 (+) Transcript_39481:362-1018(+)